MCLCGLHVGVPKYPLLLFPYFNLLFFEMRLLLGAISRRPLRRHWPFNRMPGPSHHSPKPTGGHIRFLHVHFTLNNKTIFCVRRLPCFVFHFGMSIFKWKLTFNTGFLLIQETKSKNFPPKQLWGTAVWWCQHGNLKWNKMASLPSVHWLHWPAEVVQIHTHQSRDDMETISIREINRIQMVVLKFKGHKVLVVHGIYHWNKDLACFFLI